MFHVGKYLMGLASLLVEVKSYDEFMELAEKGTDHSTATMIGDV